MNNDDLHLNKIPQQFDYSMQNINNSLNQNDDNCMDLLDKLTYDDNTSNATIYTPSNIGVKDDDKFTQEIMSALDKKDFDRILTLALSQSHNGNKMGNLLTETIHEIEKNSNKPIDGKIMEKLHSLLRSQPKSIATTTPLRATVAPIRNESIVCSSSSNMSNNTGFRSNKTTKSETSQDDFLSLISSDCKLPSGTRSLPATPPITQVPNRPLSSHCVPIRSNEQRKRSDCDIEQLQQQQQQIPFCAYGTPQNQQAQMQYVPINVNQFAQYQPSMMSPNIFVMPVMNNPEGQGAVPQSNQVLTQGSQSGSHNNQISLLLGSPAFFSMPNSGPNQTVTTSHDAGLGSTTNTTAAVRSPALASHGSNLPKLLPKPQHPTPIMPRMTQYPSGPMQHQMTHLAQPHHPQPMQNQQNQPQPFKRPTNRKSAVKTRPTSSRSSKTTKKENCSSNKDNVLMAWEMSGQCGGDDDNLQHSSASFITELTNGVTPDQFCLLPSSVDGNSLEGFCHGLSVSSDGGHNEFDELLDELVTILDVHYAQVVVEETKFESCVVRIEPASYQTSSIINTPFLGGCVAMCRQMVVPSSNCVVIVRQMPLIDPTSLLPRSASTASNVDQQRVMQLLYAHLGRHSEILTPLLKCLLPPTPTSTSLVSNPHQHHSRPLSVCTRLSEQDELTEDDLLADISPVKRDPTQLANLDRFLESCQSISPCSSMLQDYEEHEEPSFDDAKLLLPFQTNADENFTLQDFCGLNHRGGVDAVAWLRKSKQRNKWAFNGTLIRSSKVLELPTQISIVTEKRKEKYLKKKVTYKKCGISIPSPSSEYKMRKKSRQERRTIKYLEKIREIKRENHKNEFREEEDQYEDDRVEMDLGGKDRNDDEEMHLPLTNYNENASQQSKHEEETFNEDILANPGSVEKNSSGCLKVRIRLSQLKVVATTIVRSPEPPPPPLVDIAPQKPEIAMSIKQPRRAKIKSNLAIIPPLVQRQTKKHTELNTKRIFCTRKEDRRSSALNTSSSTSPIKHRKVSPCKMKRGKPAPPEHPPLILKLCTKRQEQPVSPQVEMQTSESVPSVPVAATPPLLPSQATTGRLKLRLKLSQNCCYTKQQGEQNSNEMPVNEVSSMKNTYEFSPAAVTLAPPVHHRPRPQLAALQFSPTHSSSDSDVDGAHNEISSLLQRQEQRDPLSASVGAGTVDTSSSHHHQNSFPQLPVPYLVGSDPTVFIDPHEFDLVIVKNSKYKKVSQRELGTEIGAAVVDVVSDAANNNNELFVPGCFIEQEKSQMPSWNHSSPSMPVLAPQEPFSTTGDNSGKSNHISLSAYDYSNQSQINQASQQPYSDPSDRLQQSPLCMTTSTNPQTSQYSQSQNDMRPDTIKSPYQHQSSYYQQQAYNSSCYLADNSVSAVAATAVTNQSKTQIHSSPVAPQQTTTGSSHIQDYSTYFQNASQIQSLASSDTASFSSISLTSSAYQPISDHQSSKHTTSKRSSSSRSHQSEQASAKKRKEPPQPSLQLPSYSNNADIYNAAVQYSNFDYYSNGFSDIIGGIGSIDRVKLYEQWSRECSNPLNAFCPSNLQWNSAMAEYCKQAASLMPQTASGATSGFGLGGNANPLSLTSNLNPVGSAMDYSNDISHSVDSLKYLDSYTAYAMTQPYMYPAFGGIPK